MKRVMVMLMAVILCSLSAWSQSSMIVTLGTNAMEDNSFDVVSTNFSQYGMPLDVMPSGKYGYMCERPVLMAVVDVNSNNKVKEVDFLCGAAGWWEIDIHLEEAGYAFDKESNATLGNGDVVPQKAYSKGTILCLVQTIDRNMKQIIFKKKSQPKPKSSKRR